MTDHARRIRNPRCFFVYALAPKDLPAASANRAFNAFVADRKLPLVLYHDHFIGQPGGIAIFYVANPEDRDRLLDTDHLMGWQVEIQPLIFSFSPAALDEQISYTLRAYRELDWAELRHEKRPSYGDPGREAETARESDD